MWSLVGGEAGGGGEERGVDEWVREGGQKEGKGGGIEPRYFSISAGTISSDGPKKKGLYPKSSVLP